MSSVFSFKSLHGLLFVYIPRIDIFKDRLESLSQGIDLVFWGAWINPWQSALLERKKVVWCCTYIYIYILV